MKQGIGWLRAEMRVTRPEPPGTLRSGDSARLTPAAFPAKTLALFLGPSFAAIAPPLCLPKSLQKFLGIYVGHLGRHVLSIGVSQL
jgi:hypothetical protein